MRALLLAGHFDESALTATEQFGVAAAGQASGAPIMHIMLS